MAIWYIAMFAKYDEATGTVTEWKRPTFRKGTGSTQTGTPVANHGTVVFHCDVKRPPKTHLGTHACCKIGGQQYCPPHP